MVHHEATPIEPSDAESSRLRPILTVGDSVQIPPRRFNVEDLRTISTVLSGGPFTILEWAVGDQQGLHEGSAIDEILGNVLWRTVHHFSVHAVQTVPAGDQTRRAIVNVHVEEHSLRAEWSCQSGCDREAVERAFRKVVLLLQELPLGEDLNVFETRTAGDNLRAKDEPRPVEAALHVNGPWWDPRRAPQSVVDWLVIGTAGALVAGVVVGILWRLG